MWAVRESAAERREPPAEPDHPDPNSVPEAEPDRGRDAGPGVPTAVTR